MDYDIVGNGRWLRMTPELAFEVWSGGRIVRLPTWVVDDLDPDDVLFFWSRSTRRLVGVARVRGGVDSEREGMGVVRAKYNYQNVKVDWFRPESDSGFGARIPRWDKRLKAFTPVEEAEADSFLGRLEDLVLVGQVERIPGAIVRARLARSARRVVLDALDSDAVVRKAWARWWVQQTSVVDERGPERLDRESDIVLVPELASEASTRALLLFYRREVLRPVQWVQSIAEQRRMFEGNSELVMGLPLDGPVGSFDALNLTEMCDAGLQTGVFEQARELDWRFGRILNQLREE